MGMQKTVSQSESINLNLSALKEACQKMRGQSEQQGAPRILTGLDSLKNQLNRDPLQNKPEQRSTVNSKSILANSNHILLHLIKRPVESI